MSKEKRRIAELEAEIADLQESLKKKFQTEEVVINALLDKPGKARKVLIDCYKCNGQGWYYQRGYEASTHVGFCDSSYWVAGHEVRCKICGGKGKVIKEIIELE